MVRSDSAMLLKSGIHLVGGQSLEVYSTSCLTSAKMAALFAADQTPKKAIRKPVRQ